MISIGVVASAIVAASGATYCATGGAVSPGVYVYKVLNGVTTELTLPTAFTNVKKVKWSPDGTYLAVAASAAPYFGIFKRDGDVFTALSLANTTNVTTLAVYSIAWHPNGDRLIIGKTNSNKQVMIGVSGSTVTELLLYSAPTKSQANDMQFSADGKYLAVGWGKNNGAYGMYIYSYNSTTHALSTVYSDTTIVYDAISVDIVNNSDVPKAVFGTTGTQIELVHNLTTKQLCTHGESATVVTSTKLSPDGGWFLAARNTKPSGTLFKYVSASSTSNYGNPAGNTGSYGTIDAKFKSDGSGFYMANAGGTTVFSEYSFDTATGVFALVREVPGTAFTRACCDWVETA